MKILFFKKRFLVLLFSLVSIEIFPQNFTDLGVSFTGVTDGNAIWGDYDNDNDLDVLVVGNGTTRIYRNDGGSVFTYVSTSMVGISLGTCAWGDYDNDGDLDIAITGNNGSTKTTKIYRNDGSNVFTDINAGLIGLDYSTLDWGDYDNDGKLDLIVSGFGTGEEPTAKLYHNDGSNTFTDSRISITPCVNGMIKWGDYNNDDLLDILMYGKDFNGNSNTEIYRNDGSNNFISINSNLNDGFRGGVDWGDYDNDGDLDIIMGGQSSGTNIYQNNNGIFTNINTGFQPLSYGAVSWGDYDNDGDLDVVFAGVSTSNGLRYTQLYQNKGNNVFTEDANIIVDVNLVSFAWGDYDYDGDVDLLMTGSDNNLYYSKIYRNDSSTANSSPTTPTGIQSTVINNGAILKWNPSTDSKTPSTGLTYNARIGTTTNGIDILSPMSNISTGYRKVAKLGNAMLDDNYLVKNLPVGTYYWSVQAIDPNFNASAFSSTGSFIILPSTTDMNINILKATNASSAWGDYDNDGIMDLLLIGWDETSSKTVSKIYHNSGSAVFDTINAKLRGVYYGTCAWGDYDNDGDLDIFLAGNTGSYPNYNPISKIYRNNGNGTFTDINASISGVGFSSSAWGDYDNDGDLDILLTGSGLSTIYRNDGNGIFVDIQVNFVQSYFGTASWGDYDKDGDLDVLVCGTSKTEIYRNNGSDSFTSIGTNLPGGNECSSAWGDYNNDGLLDILFTGSYFGYNSVKIFRNIGNDEFTDINAGFRGVSESSGIWCDLNNDGYSDVLYTGRSGSFISKIYINNKNGTFTDIYATITAYYRSKLSTADYDNDGDLDFFITQYGTKPLLYRNNMNFPNDPPNTPSNLKVENSGLGAILSWDPSTDNQSTNGGLYYNIRLGKTTLGHEITSPMVTPMPGNKRLIPSMGNAQMNTSWRIDSLPVGTYYWSVQAIDQSFTGGAWASEQQFTVSQIRPFFTSDTVCFGDSTIFIDQTIVTGTEIESWSWDFGDGESSTLQHPKHKYSTAGTFSVKLEVSDINGVKMNRVNSVLVLPHPIADFNISNICIGSTTNIANISDTDTLAITSWTWNLGDGTIIAQQDPGSHGYLNTGTYDISLSILAKNGCSSTKVLPITVAEYPSSIVYAAGSTEICEGGNVKLSVPYNNSYSYEWEIGSTPILQADSSVFIATYSGNFRVKVTNLIANCVSESITSVPVTVTSPPAKPIIIEENNNTLFCFGTEVKLIVTNHSSLFNYQWTLSKVAIDGANQANYQGKLSAGDYRVVASLGSCSTESDKITLSTKSALPKPTIVGHGPNIWVLACDNMSAVDYRWYFNNSLIPGANKYQFVANKNYGDYYVAVNDGGECYTPSDVFRVDMVNIIDELIEDVIMIYPNPSNGLFNVTLGSTLPGELNIQVIDELGIIVEKYNFTNAMGFTIDLSGFPNGIYLCKMYYKNKIVVRKIVKQKYL